MAELLPCPFCGHSAIVVRERFRHEESLYYVQCGNTATEGGGVCSVNPQTYRSNDLGDAIKMWNTRTPKERGVDNG